MTQLTKKETLRRAAVNVVNEHYRATGINLYFRNQISHAVKHAHIEDAVKSLEKDGTFKRVKIKGAVAYKLTNPIKRKK